MNRKTLTEKEIIAIIEKRLPKIIEKHPEVKRKIEEILEKKAATKDDIKAILLELQRQREEANKRFEMLERENAKRFEAMERENAKRFEAIERRFETMERRFEILVKEMRAGFEALDRKIETRISALGSRWGIYAEDAFRKTFEELLPGLGYKVIKWKKIDEKGVIFSRPRPVEIDILIKNKKRIAIEIKSSLTIGELEIFEKSVKFYEREEREKITEKIVVTLFPYPGVEEYAGELKIKVIKSEREAENYLK